MSIEDGGFAAGDADAACEGGGTAEAAAIFVMLAPED